MYLKDIKGYNWNVSDDLKIRKNDITTIGMIEQECHLNVLRCGFTNEEKPEILVDCTNQMYITLLCKSEYFTLKEVLLSSNPRAEGFILSVKGILENNGLTIRRKKPVFSEEEKQARAERMKMMAQKRYEKQHENEESVNRNI